MNLKELKQRYQADERLAEICQIFSNSPLSHVQIKGMCGSVQALIAYGISKNILTEIKGKDTTYYTLTPYGEQQLSTMISIIIEGWKKITNAIQTKDIDTFMRMVKEYEYWIKYLRYTKLVSTEDADFVLSSYKEILKSRQKKKRRILETLSYIGFKTTQQLHEPIP